MTPQKFTQSIAKRLTKELQKENIDFFAKHKQSNSYVQSNSQYIELFYPAGYDGSIQTIRISDHFVHSQGADFNLDITAEILNLFLVKKYVTKIIEGMEIIKCQI